MRKQPVSRLLRMVVFSIFLLTLCCLGFGCSLLTPDNKASASALESQLPDFDDSTSYNSTTRTVSESEVGRDPERADVVMTFVGDCTLGDINGWNLFAATYDAQGAEYFLDGVRHVFEEDDLTVVNLEGPLTNATSQIDKGDPPVFWIKGRPEFINILSSSSVELANIANNHIYDYGDQGVSDTKQALDGAEIEYYGYANVFVREINGVKIGIFGFAFDSNAFNIQQQVQALKDDGCDVVIATFHEGHYEKTYDPTSSQRAAAYAAIDAGADLVIQHHVHNLLGIEEYNGTPIAYSLGNFCYGGHSNPSDKDTMIFRFEINRSPDGFAFDYQVIPASISSSTDRNDYRPQILEGSEAQRVLDKLTEISAGL